MDKGTAKVDVREDGAIRFSLSGVTFGFPPEVALKIAYMLIKVTTREYPEMDDSRLAELIAEVDKEST